MVGRVHSEYCNVFYVTFLSDCDVLVGFCAPRWERDVDVVIYLYSRTRLSYFVRVIISVYVICSTRRDNSRERLGVN